MRRTMMSTALVSLLTATFVLAGPALAAKTTSIVQEGEGTTKSISEEGCQTGGGTCTDRIMGSISGKPVENQREKSSDKGPAGIRGTVSADYSAPVIDPIAGTFTVPATGDVILTDRRNGGRLVLRVEGDLTGANTGPATLEGTFTVKEGKGAFSDVRGGSGTISAIIVDSGEEGTFTASLEGTLERKGN